MRDRLVASLLLAALALPAARAGGPDPDSLVARGDSLLAAGDSVAAVPAWSDGGWGLLRSGRPDDALAVWSRTLEVARAIGDSGTIAAALNDRAVGHAVSGDYETSLRLWSEAIRLHRALGNRRSEGVAWGNLANAYNLLGRLPEAKEATERAYDLAVETDNARGIVACHHRLASILRETGQAEEALVHADSAVAIARRDDPASIGTTQGRRSTILFELGRLDEAIEAAIEAEEAARARGDLRSASATRGNRAAMLLRRGRAGEALALAESVREELRAESPLRWASFQSVRGRALLELGRVDEARAVLEGALEDLSGPSGAGEGTEGLFLRVGDVYLALAELHLRAGRDEEAWRVIERGRASAFRRELEDGVGGDRLAPGRVPGPATLAEVQESLARAGRAALVQYNDARQLDLVAWVITPDTLRAVRLGPPDAVLDAARHALDVLASGAGEVACRAALARPAETLLAPIVPLLPPDLERLVLVPPTRLAAFPFEALPLPDAPGGPTLGQRWAVSRMPGASALPRLEARRAATGPMLVFADPAPAAGERSGAADAALVASPTRDALRQPLPEAREEAARVAARGAVVLVGEAATAEAFRAGPDTGGASVLHFATHAVADPWRRDRSGLVLAGPDGLLTAGEVETRPLAADLVTLSGCRTAGGRTILGEGIDGLPRAFLLAGCRSVVTTLWDVEDGAARRFMERFYGALGDGLRRDEALREARRRLAAEGVPPRDRDAFVLTGVGHEAVPALAGRVPRRRGPILLTALLATAIGGLAFLRLSPRATS